MLSLVRKKTTVSGQLWSSNNTNSATRVSETAPSIKGNLVFLLYLIIASSDFGDYC